MGNVGLAFAVALSACFVSLLSYVFSGFWTPLLTGAMAGIFIGHPEVGLQVGATCSLMSIGFYTYGGAVTPSYGLGAIFGTVVAVQSGNYNQGIVVGSVVALLGSWFDILQGLMATGFIHGADKALAKNNIRGFEAWHLNGMWTIQICNFVPVFVGMLFIDKYQLIVDFVNQYSWFEQGISVVGSVLPAVGFAMLLSYMDIKRFWPFMIIGYVLFAYLKLPTLGLALLGTALAYIYAFKLEKLPESRAAEGGESK